MKASAEMRRSPKDDTWMCKDKRACSLRQIEKWKTDTLAEQRRYAPKKRKEE